LAKASRSPFQLGHDDLVQVGVVCFGDFAGQVGAGDVGQRGGEPG
jgi:hypothetical protein